MSLARTRFLRHTLLALTCLAPLASAACGGVVDGGGDATPHGDDTSTTLDPTDPSGSYDLTFTSATADIGPGGPPPPAGQPPSLSVKARLDLRASGDGFDAVLTSRWGTSAPYAVAVQKDSLVLTGHGGIASDANGYGAWDEWSTITLPRTDRGGLTGAVQGTGTEMIGEGDVEWQGALTGAGSLVPDATDPEAKTALGGSPNGPADALLPWDALRVTAAEPVDAQAAATNLGVTGDHGDGLAVTFAPATGATWAGTTELVGFATDWAHASSEPWSLTATGTGFRDLVGRAAGPLVAPIKFLGLSSPTGSIEFDSDVVMATTWGSVDFYGGGLAGTDDPRCEAGGCARIGPITYDLCAPARAGLAGQLQRGSGDVELRYRVLFKPQYDEGGSTPFVYGDVVTMELASQGAAAIDAPVNAGSVTFDALPTAIDGMTYGSAWTTFRATAPAGSGPIGVAITASHPSQFASGCGGPPPPPLDLEILVERIDAAK